MFSIRGQVVTPSGVIDNGTVVIDDGGCIAEVGNKASTARSGDIDASGFLVVPGFIDMHVHGGGGGDFMHGTEDAVRQVLRTHSRFGTTSLLATTLTASRDAIDASIRAVRIVAEGERGVEEARVVGIHLEGPYICKKRKGAQPEAHVRRPDVSEFAHWVDIGSGLIKEITIAPEEPNAQAVIKMAAARGVIASVGHTDATSTQVQAAVAWGARQATHVFNAMRGMEHREPGTAGTALAMPEILAELICDGVHIAPLVVKVIVDAKGRHGVTLITDAIEAAAMPDGEYTLGGFTIHAREGRAVLADGTLAGSLLTMNRAFHNVQEFAAIGPEAAVDLAAGNAARQLRLDDRFGSIAPGLAADVAVVDPSTGDVAWTIIDGKVAYRR